MSKLAELNEEYMGINVAEVSDRGNKPKDGHYQARIVGAEMDESRNNNPMVVITLQIVGPTYRGAKLRKYRVISQKLMPYLKKDLATCGITLGNLQELPSRVYQLVGVLLEIEKKTNGDYDSIYFNRRIMETQQAPPQQQAPPAQPILEFVPPQKPTIGQPQGKSFIPQKNGQHDIF